MTVDDIRADLEKIAERLDRTQQSIANELMPATPSHLDPGERYARAFDLARLGVVDARHRAQRLLDQLNAEVAGARPGPFVGVIVHFATSPGVTACGEEYAAITDVAANVTCPACRTWLLDPDRASDPDRARVIAEAAAENALGGGMAAARAGSVPGPKPIHIGGPGDFVGEGGIGCGAWRNQWNFVTDPADPAITCPACLEWIGRNVPPDVSVLDEEIRIGRLPVANDVPEPGEGEG